MIDFKEILKYCKRLSEGFLKGAKNSATSTEDFISPEDEEDLLRDLHDKSYWTERERSMSQINTDREWKDLESKIHIPETGNRYYWRYAAAAVILVGLGAGTYYYSLWSPVKPVQGVTTNQQIVSGSDKAILTLEDGKEIELSKEVAFSSKDANLVDDELSYTSEENTGAVRFNTLTIPRGGKFKVQLSDGTKVWLNAESQLKYPVAFHPGQPREVELLYGEAYFEVTSSTLHKGAPFIVNQKHQKIEVLGTQFNISAYPESNAIYTTLVEGRVAVNTLKSSTILKPGQQAINQTASGNIQIRPVETSYATAWKDGMFLFKDESLNLMMQQLSRWYDVKIEFLNTEKQNYTFSGSLKRTDNIEKLLKSLEQTGEVEFEIKNKTIMIK